MMRRDEPTLHIRPGMDVYSAYQDQYIGSVIAVWRSDGSAGTAAERGAGARETGSATQSAEANPHLQHEEGRQVQPTGYVGHRQLGEEMGPFPTKDVGNTGPTEQSAQHAYATDGEPGSVFCFAVRPGRINLGLLTPPLYIPTSSVHSVSMERVVLSVQKDEMPEEWRRRPAGL